MALNQFVNEGKECVLVISMRNGYNADVPYIFRAFHKIFQHAPAKRGIIAEAEILLSGWIQRNRQGKSRLVSMEQIQPLPIQQRPIGLELDIWLVLK